MVDIAVLGGGPAGLSAAITARSRGKSVAVLTINPAYSGLWKAERVDNYPGLPNISGKELIERMTEQAKAAGAELIRARITGMMDTGDGFLLNAGTEMYEAKAVILATGVVMASKYPGETEFLGMGVSYCATCDGMFYRGKKAAVVGRSPDAPEEANALQDMGVDVFYTGLTVDRPEGLHESIPYISAKKVEVQGEGKVNAILLDGTPHEVEGVFILRQTVAPTAILPELAMENGYVKIDRQMKTSAKGVFAAGDCTGKPLQIAKAVGEGLIAALSAVEYLSGR